MKNILLVILISLSLNSVAQTNYYYATKEDSILLKTKKLKLKYNSEKDYTKMSFYKLSRKQIKKVSVSAKSRNIFGISRSYINEEDYIQNKKISASLKDTSISIEKIYEVLYAEEQKNTKVFVDICGRLNPIKTLTITKFNLDSTLWTYSVINISYPNFSTLNDFKHWYELVQLDISKKNKNKLIRNEFNKELYHSIMLRYWEKIHPN